MSKISKFIICCLAVIISICSLCVPTYCTKTPPSSSYSIELTSDFNSYPNFYNNSNLKFVYVENIDLFRNNDAVFYCRFYSLYQNLKDLNGTSRNYNYDLYVHYYDIDNIKIGNLSVTYYFEYTSDNVFKIIQTNSIYTPIDNVHFPLDYSNVQWANISLSVPHCPLEIMSLLPQEVPNVILYNFWNITFELNYNNQYFYNNYFGMNFYCDWPLKVYQYKESSSRAQLAYSLYDNNDYLFSSSFNDFYLEGFLFKNDFNYMESYINKVSLLYDIGYFGFGTMQKGYLASSNYMSSVFCFSHSLAYSGTNSYTLYSSNSYGQESLNSSIIPIGSNNFYKTAEWWDIPTHLYNFFIYLVFDAPIISNFTNLVMVIINFIVEVFGFFIGLFNGINNIFFISIFIGIIALIFLLKIIFKG